MMQEHQKIRDSGIEWYEKIPHHWKIIKLKFVANEITGGLASGERDDHGIIQLRMNNISTNGRINAEKILKVPIPNNVDFYLLRKEDLLFNNTNSLDLIGKTSMYNNEFEKCIFSNHLTRIRMTDRILPKWLLYHLLHQWNAVVIEYLLIHLLVNPELILTK